MIKTCKDCNADISDRANQAKRCPACVRKRGIKARSRYNKAHPEMTRKAAKNYRLRHPDRIIEQNAKLSEYKSYWSRWSRYGITKADVEAMLTRQRGRCLGCQILLEKPCIDHNHETGKIRGLLCSKCNTALGLVNEDPATLRRLMAYLDYDRDKILVYLIGALKNPRIPEIGNILRGKGYDVMDEWFTPGEHADENWQKYEALRGRSYQEALRGRAATNIYLFDRAYLDLADIVIMVAPAGKSAMLELGYAKGSGKQTYILLDGQDPERYDIMPGLADNVFFDLDALLRALETSNLRDKNEQENRVYSRAVGQQGRG